MSEVYYAVIAAIVAGFYSYFQRLASPNVNQLFGALVVSAAAFTIAALLLVFQLGKIRMFTNPVGMWFLLGAGAAAFSIDYFTLQAYSRGLPITVGAPIGIAGGVATAVVIGLLLGEHLSFAKLAGIILVVMAVSCWLPINNRPLTRRRSSPAEVATSRAELAEGEMLPSSRNLGTRLDLVPH